MKQPDSIFGSKQLPFKDFALNPAATSPPAQIAAAPRELGMVIRGFCVGTAGHFVHISKSENAFDAPPTNSAFPFFPDAFSVPTGERFEVTLAPGQVLWGIATVGSAAQQVWVTFTAEYVE